MPQITQESPALPVTDKLAWTDPELVELGFGSRTTLWRLRRDDPDFPEKIKNRTSAEAIRAYYRSRRQAA